MLFGLGGPRQSDLHSAVPPESSPVAILRQDLPRRWHGEEIPELRSIAQEADDSLYLEALLNLAGRLESKEQLGEAHALYQLLSELPPEGDTASVSRRAGQRRDKLLGQGGAASQVETFARNFIRQAADPISILGFGVAGATFKLTRAALLSRLATGPLGGMAARGIANTLAFGAESLAFSASLHGLNHLSGRANSQSLAQDIYSGTIFLAAMKMTGALAKPLLQRIHRFNGLGQATRLAALAPLSRRVLPQVLSFGGIMAGHGAEEALGLRQAPTGAQRWIDGLSTYLNLQAGGVVARRALGRRFHAWEERLDRQAEEMVTSSAVSNSRVSQSPWWWNRLGSSGRQLALAPLSLILGNIGDGTPPRTSPTSPLRGIGRLVAKLRSELFKQGLGTEWVDEDLAKRIRQEWETFSVNPPDWIGEMSRLEKSAFEDFFLSPIPLSRSQIADKYHLRRSYQVTLAVDKWEASFLQSILRKQFFSDPLDIPLALLDMRFLSRALDVSTVRDLVILRSGPNFGSLSDVDRQLLQVALERSGIDRGSIEGASSLRSSPPPSILHRPLLEFPWEIAIQRAFYRLKLSSVRDLTEVSEKKLLGVSRFGSVALLTVKSFLRAHGLSLAMKNVVVPETRSPSPELPREDALFDSHAGDSFLEELNLSAPLALSLENLNIRSVGELIRHSESSLAAKIGKASLQEIKRLLEGQGLALGAPMPGLPVENSAPRASIPVETLVGLTRKTIVALGELGVTELGALSRMRRADLLLRFRPLIVQELDRTLRQFGLRWSQY